jgi:flagellin
MAISLLTNVASMEAQDQLNQTSTSLQSTLARLSSGQRINSGADDPAGLAIANQLQASVTALQQSALNTNTGIGLAQTADGALSQVTTLLNRAITISTEAANGGLSNQQLTALDTEFSSIKSEIDRIGTSTTFNGSTVFASGTTSIFLSDAASTSTIGVSVGTLSASGLGLSSTGIDLTSTGDAASALSAVNSAIQTVAATRGSLGASINRLNAAANVINNQVVNISQTESNIMSTNVPQEVSNLAKYQVLNQTGIAALTQSNQVTQSLLGLFR